MVNVLAAAVGGERRFDTGRIAHQKSHLVASLKKCRHRVGANEPGSTGNQYSHAGI